MALLRKMNPFFFFHFFFATLTIFKEESKRNECVSSLSSAASEVHRSALTSEACGTMALVFLNKYHCKEH